MEVVVESANHCITELEKKVKTVLDFFPIEELKHSDDIHKGEDYIARVSKTACLGIFNDTRANVSDDAAAKIEQLEKVTTAKLQDQARQLLKLRAVCDALPDVKREVSLCTMQLTDKASKDDLAALQT